MERIAMVDRVIEITVGDTIVCKRGLTVTEPLFGDHFPNFPVLPGVLMVEAINQAVEILCTESFINERFSLKTINGVKFRKYGRPGDCLLIKVTITKKTSKQLTCKASIGIEDELCATVSSIEYGVKARRGHESK